jgi:hypothetical protein
VYGEREQGDDRCGDGDQNGAQAHDAGIEYRLFERFAFGVHFLDEIKEYDDVADNNPNEADNSEERHETEWRAHNPEGSQSSDGPVRNGSEDDERLNRAVELKRERKKDSCRGNQEYDSQLAKASSCFSCSPPISKDIPGVDVQRLRPIAVEPA